MLARADGRRDGGGPTGVAAPGARQDRRPPLDLENKTLRILLHTMPRTRSRVCLKRSKTDSGDTRVHSNSAWVSFYNDA